MIITSLLDTDLYKLTMMQAVAEKFPKAIATYQFVNRDKTRKFTPEMVKTIAEEIKALCQLKLTPDELVFLEKSCPFLKPNFIDTLIGARLLAHHVEVHLSSEGDLSLVINGPWYQTILFETPILAIISQAYMTTPWHGADQTYILEEAHERAWHKGEQLSQASCKFADFGTRRRFSYHLQRSVLIALARSSGFIGTSNVHFARILGVKPIGTMAHEWIQGVSGLVGLRHANRYAMEIWNEVFEGDLGIALTDTFGCDAFWSDFNGVLSRLFDGVRQDSGDPYAFADRAVAEYTKHRIDPASKSIIFSDSLDVDKAIKIRQHCGARIKCSFGIGTNFTNDVPNHPPMNMVIKLVEIDGIPVVKISEDPRKAIGDPKAIEVAKWTFGIRAEKVLD